jgi:O-antigen/teichoic acid export membrane protein
MSDRKKPEDITNTDESLQKVAKGTLIILIGLLMSFILGIIGRVVVVRYWTQEDYGIFSLSIIFLNLALIVSSVGLSQGAIRNIAYSRSKNEKEKIKDFVSSSIWISVLVSIVLCAIIFFSSDIISEKFFHEPGLSTPLKIFAIVLPFYSLIDILVSLFRGFDNIKPTVYFQYILISLLFPSFLLVIIFFNSSFVYIFYAYAASTILTCFFLIIYSIRFTKSLSILSTKSITSPATRELMFFSLPLLGAGLLNFFIFWTDTLMLGNLKTFTDVGLYNAAQPLSQFVCYPSFALILIYIPIFSGLYAKGMFSEIRRNFLILTKWLCSLTFPLFIILFLFAEPLLELFFGSTYIPSANALRILSLGYIIFNFFGPNRPTLIVTGNTRFVMFSSLIAVILNIGLDLILIPQFGIVGAATASAISLVSISLVMGYKLYLINGTHPLSKNLIKPVILFSGFSALAYLFIHNYLTIELWMLPVLCILFYAIYILFVIITKSLDEEDLKLFIGLEKKFGLRYPKLERFLSGFK